MWIPLFEEIEGAKLWAIGIAENELRCIKLSPDESEPNPLSKLNPRNVPLKPVLLDNFWVPHLSKKLQ